jgi:protein-S-isoprenylcysteine O-methyltransferase Ste14
MRFLENRIPPPIVGLLTGLGMWAVARVTPVIVPPHALRWGVAGALVLAGLMLTAPAVMAFARAHTTVNPLTPDAATALVTGGVYRITRNPMYLGMALALLGFTVFLAAPAALIGPVAFVAYITRFQIVPEERVMRAKFGAAFEEYAGRVRLWI